MFLSDSFFLTKRNTIVLTIISFLFVTLSLFSDIQVSDIVSNNDNIIFGNQNSFSVNSAGEVYVTYGKRVDSEKYLLYFAHSTNGETFTETYIDTLYNYPYIKERSFPILLALQDKIVIYYNKSRTPSDFELWKATSYNNGVTFASEFMQDNVFMSPNIQKITNEEQVFAYIKGKMKSITGYQYYTKYETSENADDSNGGIMPFSMLDEYQGSVFSNDAINLYTNEDNHPTFHSLVTTAGSFNFSTPNPDNLDEIFQGGYLTGVPTEDYMFTDDFEPSMPFEGYDGDIVRVHIDGNSFTSMIGRIDEVGTVDFPVYSWYPQNAQQAQEAINSGYNWFDSQNIIYTNHVTIYDTVWTEGPSQTIENNQEIYVQDKELWIDGTISGKQIWGSSENVYIVGDITYQNTTAGEAPDDMNNINQDDYFGLVSFKKIIIKSKFKDPLDNFALHDDNCNGVYLYGAYCAIQEADEEVYGDMTSHFDGVLTYEYQHPHGSTPDFIGPSPYTGEDTLYTYVDLHKFIYPPDYDLPAWLLPYNVHGNNPVAPYDMCGYPYEDPNYQPGSEVAPYGTDYPWYNPVWPESAEDIVTERGVIHLFGAVYQVRKGFLHRSGNDSYNHPDNDWQLDNETFHNGSVHPSTGYGKDYHYDKRFIFNPFIDFPIAYLNTDYQKLHLSLTENGGDTFTDIFVDDVPISLMKKKMIKFNGDYYFVVQSSTSMVYVVKILSSGEIEQIYDVDLSEFSNSLYLKNVSINYSENNLYFLLTDFEKDYIVSYNLLNFEYILCGDYVKNNNMSDIFTSSAGGDTYYVRYDSDESAFKYYSFANSQLQSEDSSQYTMDINPHSRLGLKVNFPDSLSTTMNMVVLTNNESGETSSLKYVTDTIDWLGANNNNIPITNTVYKSYPNPFRPHTQNGKSEFTISFMLSNVTKIEINIYNLKGQLVKTLVNKTLYAGKHNIVWNGKDNNEQEVKSGIYFYKIKQNGKQFVKKLALIK